MSIISGTLKVGSTTYVAPSDGTEKTLGLQEQGDGVLIAFPTTDTTYLTKRTFEFSTKAAKTSPQAPNGYTQQRATCLIKFPKVLTNGNRTVNTLRLELACDIEMSNAEKLDYLLQGSQILGDSDFNGFFQNLLLA